MGDLKLFDIQAPIVTEFDSGEMELEKSLQVIFEKNLETLLGVKFLASEFMITGGRMDTLGIDENGCPVIIEYKRQRNENVINQGLFYLDWLMDHRGTFELLVRDSLGKESSDSIEWSEPRLICIAGDFTKYDEHAVKQMERNIELIRYRRFGKGLLLLDLLTAVSAKNPTSRTSVSSSGSTVYKTVSEHLRGANDKLTNLYEEVQDYMLSRGDDVQERTMKFYIAFKRIKNFACVEIKPGLNVIRMYLKVDPVTIELETGFTRDMRNTNHFGTGDLEVTLTNLDDFERAKPYIDMSYEAS